MIHKRFYYIIIGIMNNVWGALTDISVKQNTIVDNTDKPANTKSLLWMCRTEVRSGICRLQIPRNKQSS